MLSNDSLISLNNIAVQRNGRKVLTGVSFQLRPGECWAVVGPTGSGKTTLLQALAGQIPVFPKAMHRSGSVGFVSFREDSRLFSYTGHFYQQRYQATMSDEGSRGHAAPTLRDFLQITDSAEAGPLLNRLGLSALLDRTFLKLSNGQTRKARIGKALLQHPSVLVLDNPFVGVDATSRIELTHWLGDLLQHGLTMVLATDTDQIPPFATHVMELNAGQVRWTGPVQQYPLRSEHHSVTNLSLPVWQRPASPADFNRVFQLCSVSVRYGQQAILENITWTVSPGERWALLGPNGAGKSVLLSLLYGDHPQAYANEIYVFDHRRGRPGQSIWDVKRRIGFVSPELHLYFPQHLTTRQVVLTGLTDTLTPPKTVHSETEADLLALLTFFDVRELINRLFGNLSSGEQRLVLLVRALIKNPPVLILDEPFQALDARYISLARQLIDSLTNKTILFVTHDRRELPQTVNQTFVL